LFIAACGVGSYKSLLGSFECRRCPLHSSALDAGAIVCACDAGFYRALDTVDVDDRDTVDSQCTRMFILSISFNSNIVKGIPGRPQNIETTQVSPTSVTIQWQRPSSDGGRSIMWYRIECAECVRDNVQFTPANVHKLFNITSVIIDKLKPNTQYSVCSLTHTVNRSIVYIIVGVCVQ
jgi:hypothetical protein